MIIHILADGSKVDSIQGKVIKADQFPKIYGVIDQIERRAGRYPPDEEGRIKQ